MFAARAWEYRIVQHVIHRPQEQEVPERKSRSWADRLVLVLASTAVLAVLGSVLQELIWVVLAVATAVAVAAD